MSATTQGEIGFLLFYAGFLVFVVIITGLAATDLITGLTEQDILTLSDPDPFLFFNKMLILTTVSSGFGFLTLVLGILTLIAGYIVGKAIIDALPFT